MSLAVSPWNDTDSRSSAMGTGECAAEAVMGPCISRTFPKEITLHRGTRSASMNHNESYVFLTNCT